MLGFGLVRQGRARGHSIRSCTGLVRSGENGSGEVGSGLIRQGRTEGNEVGAARAWIGMVGSGAVGRSAAQHGRGFIILGVAQVWHGQLWRSGVWFGSVRYAEARQGRGEMR